MLFQNWVTFVILLNHSGITLFSFFDSSVTVFVVIMYVRQPLIVSVWLTPPIKHWWVINLVVHFDWQPGGVSSWARLALPTYIVLMQVMLMVMWRKCDMSCYQLHSNQNNFGKTFFSNLFLFFRCIPIQLFNWEVRVSKDLQKFNLIISYYLLLFCTVL